MDFHVCGGGGGARFGRAYGLGLGGAGLIPEGECEFYVKFVAAGGIELCYYVVYGLRASWYRCRLHG